MSGNDRNIGQQFKDSIAEGLRTGDFSGLSDVINETANVAIEEAGRSLNQEFKGVKSFMDQNVNQYSSGAATRAMQERLDKQHEQQRREREKRAREAAELKARNQAARDRARNRRNGPEIVNKNEIVPSGFYPVGEGGAKFFKIGGAIGLSFSCVAAAVRAVLLLMGLTTPSGWIVNALAIGAFGYMTVKGSNDVRIINRARHYASICGKNMYAPIAALASTLGVSEKKVVKDVKKMLRRGFFPAGHLDTKATTLMLSDSVYNDYVKCEQSSKAAEMADKEAVRSQEAKAAIAEARKREAYKKLSKEEQEELDSIMDEGMSSVEKLHKLNDEIPGEAISAKLDRLEELLKEIFDRITVHPEQMHRMHKLMDYYLPTMLKLVEAYRDYDKVSEPGEEIIAAKNEIEKTLDTINQAFVQLLNNLFRDSVWDVTTDAQVLKTMLAQEGLSEDKI